MRDLSPMDSLSDVLNDVPELVFAFAADGRYLFINLAAAAFLDADALEVIGYHWRDLGYPEEVMGPLSERVVQVASSGVPQRYRFRTSEQRGRLLLDMTLTPLRDGRGTVYAVLAIAHDISEFFE